MALINGMMRSRATHLAVTDDDVLNGGARGAAQPLWQPPRQTLCRWNDVQRGTGVRLNSAVQSN